MQNRIIAIDPGNEESAFCVINFDDYSLVRFGKVPNEELLDLLYRIGEDGTFTAGTQDMAIEMVASYGMPVGKDVFETVFWSGRFWESAPSLKREKIYRADVKLNLCHSKQAKDGNVIQALIDRFAYGVPNKGKGIVNKKVNKPGFFHGFANDIWQAFAVGVTYIDAEKEKRW